MASSGIVELLSIWGRSEEKLIYPPPLPEQLTRPFLLDGQKVGSGFGDEVI